LKYTENGDSRLSFDGVMNLEDWDGLAVASINKTCEALHTGQDGIKTWSEVAVHADVLFNKTREHMVLVY
jgi:hypothetical protein